MTHLLEKVFMFLLLGVLLGLFFPIQWHTKMTGKTVDHELTEFQYVGVNHVYVPLK